MAFRSDPMVPWIGGGNKGGNNNGGNKGGGNGGGGANQAVTLPAFQPGQLNALATDLNAGFGGGIQKWKQDLRNTFDPTKMRPFDYTPGRNNGGGSKGGNNGGNGGRDPRNPGGQNPGGQNTGGGFVPTRPQNAMMPAQMMQPGLLSPMMQQGQQMQSGLLGPIPPAVLQFIAQGRR